MALNRKLMIIANMLAIVFATLIMAGCASYCTICVWPYAANCLVASAYAFVCVCVLMCVSCLVVCVWPVVVVGVVVWRRRRDGAFFFCWRPLCCSGPQVASQ